MPIKAKEIGFADLQLLCGIHEEHWKATRNAILAEAHRQGKIQVDQPIKTGVWKYADSWVIVSGKQAMMVTEKAITEINKPIFKGKIIELGNSNWLDWKAFTTAWESKNSIRAICLYFK